MSKKRISTITLVLVIVVLTAAGSWIAGSTIKSPAEVAARTAPPVSSPILVPVEERVLTSDIVTRGTARFGLPQPISIVPSVLKPDPGVITTLPAPNTQLYEGDLMLTISGRPVFVLQGEAPVYRDLVPGISGADVHQLETALKRLGFDPGPVDGMYDEQTSAAVADWYASVGFEPFGPTVEQLASIRALEQELAVAINNKLATDAVASAAPLAVEAARARANHASKVAVADRVNIADLAVAQAALESAQLAGELEIRAAVDAQNAAEREARLANEVAVRIAANLDMARRKTGMQVPVDEIVFLPTVPVRIKQINTAVGDPVSGPVLTVTNNQLVIDSSLRLDEAPLVELGMAAAIHERNLDIKATGIVGTVADTACSFGVDGFHVYLEILVDETPLSLEGVSLRLTIPIESTGGAVTAVPVSALSLAADGTSRLQVDNNGVLEFLIVEPGLSADGFVEVTPTAGSLVPGQLVVVGYK